MYNKGFTATLILLLCFVLCLCPVCSAANTDCSFSGQKSQKDGVYTIDNSFVITPPADNSEFNKFSITYSSTQPLNGRIEYSYNTRKDGEDFFLEAGEKLTFSSFIDDYTNSKYQNKVTSITLSTIKDVTAEFELYEFKTEKAAVLKEKTVFLQTDKFKVGINLLWGGGISYIEDKLDGDNTYTNLLNNHDTGRLVQQSYYGTNKAPYECGKYGDNVWPYNPVQGGDLSGNASKLVDCLITDSMIYVKSRPLDWAKNGSLTYSYMENIYKIEDKFISVYNGFTDFSGFDNPKTTQELPAFYTISNLGTFYCYEGTNPWTDAELKVMPNLKFWGENTDGRVDYGVSNTETWSAWVNKNDWGIGLYVPNVTMLVAGRYEYDGSKSPSSNSTNYVAPVREMVLKFAEKIEYNYLITTGKVDEIRATFKANRDFADNASLSQKIEAGFSMTNIIFDTDAALSFFTIKNECDVTTENGLLKFTAKNIEVNDPYANFDFTTASETLKASDYPYVVITYMLPKSNSGSAYTSECFFGSGDILNAEGGKSKTFTVKSDGKFHSQVIDLSKASYWTENINFIRFDFFSAASEDDAMYLYSVKLAGSKEQADEFANEEAAKAAEAYSEQTTMAETTKEPETVPSETVAPETLTPGTETNAPQSGTEASVSVTEEQTDPVPSGEENGNTLIYVIIGVALFVVSVVVILVVAKKKKA